MEILSINNQFHVAVDGKILGSFPTEKEAEAFKASCIKGEMKELTPEEKDRLLTVDQVMAGEALEPTFSGNHVTTAPVVVSDSPVVSVGLESEGVVAPEEESAA